MSVPGRGLGEEPGWVIKGKWSHSFSAPACTQSSSSPRLPRSSTDGKVAELQTPLQAIFGGVVVCVCVMYALGFLATASVCISCQQIRGAIHVCHNSLH